MSDKLPKVKHNHTLTDILKASIFSLVMIAPITAIGITCAYVVCNKNAYQSYSDIANEKVVNLTIDSVLQDNYEYTIYMKQNDLSNISDNFQIGFYDINLDIENITGFNNVNAIMFHANGYVNLYHDSTQLGSYSINEINGVASKFLNTAIYFTMNTSLTQRLNVNPNYTFVKQIILTYKSLDNVFYYAVDTMQNNTLFSWTKTTAIYTPVNAMTTGMGINTPAIAVLLVYWLLCTAVYIIIDIVVKGFTWLTHLIGER